MRVRACVCEPGKETLIIDKNSQWPCLSHQLFLFLPWGKRLVHQFIQALQIHKQWDKRYLGIWGASFTHKSFIYSKDGKKRTHFQERVANYNTFYRFVHCCSHKICISTSSYQTQQTTNCDITCTRCSFSSKMIMKNEMTVFVSQWKGYGKNKP